MNQFHLTAVAEFSIQYLQFQNHQGELTQALPATINDQILIKMYEAMALTRLFDTKAINLQRTGQLGTYPSCHGQEAIGAGIGFAMRPEDVFYPYYRDHAVFLLRGLPMSDILTYWNGDERGSASVDNPNSQDFPICVPIAGQCLHATGGAFAFKYRDEARVAVTTIGEGGTSKGDFYEAINLAGAWQLPLVFVVNNNQWAISTPISEQTACETIAQKAIGAGFEGIQVDGNDIIAVLAAMQYALDKARSGKGPTLIEALTYRLCDHTTADDASRYVPKEELTLAWEQEPIKRFRHYLETQSLWNEKEEQSLQTRCQEEVTKAIEEYATIPPQPITAMFDFMYETPPKSLKLQRAIAEQFKE